MMKIVMKMIPTIYGLVSVFYFATLYGFVLIDRDTAAFSKVLYPVLMSHATIMTIMSIGKPGGFFYWTPLVGKKIAISAAKLMAHMVFIFFVLNVLYAIYSLEFSSQYMDEGKKTYLASLTFYSFMIFFSLIIPLSFTVGLSNLVPRWVLSLYNSPVKLIFTIYFGRNRTMGNKTRFIKKEKKK